MTPQQLATATGARINRAILFQPIIDRAAPDFDITTPQRMAPFLAQVGHESAGLSALVENLNYSADGLRRTFKRHFTEPEFALFARHPERIANRVYANRMGNGDEASGDGWSYRGRGLIQTTGRDNYKFISDHMATDFITNPDLMADPEYAVRSAMLYWQSRGLNALADAGQFGKITRLINGGTNGEDERVALFTKAKAVFA